MKNNQTALNIAKSWRHYTHGPALWILLLLVFCSGCSLIVGSTPHEQHDGTSDPAEMEPALEDFLQEPSDADTEEMIAGVCGDGRIDPNEMCDDGDREDDETCSAYCDATPIVQVNTLFEGSQFAPAISGGEGRYVVGWTSSGSSEAGELDQHVRARLLSTLGHGLSLGPFLDEVKLNVASTVQSQYLPAVALGYDSFMAAWLDMGPSTGAPPGDVMWRLMNITSGTGLPEQAIGATAMGSAQNWARVAGDLARRFLAVWVSSDAVPRSAMCEFYDSSTELWYSAMTCSAGASENEAQVDVAMSAYGLSAAAWSRGSSIVVQLFASTGDRNGVEMAFSGEVGSSMEYPSIAFDGEGRILVTWRHLSSSGETQVMGRLISSEGEPVAGGYFQINDTGLPLGAGTSANPNYVPDAAGDPAGGLFLVVWDAPGAGGGRGRIVIDQETFGINRLVRGSPEDVFSSTADFPITPVVHPQMDEFSAACALENFCFVVWSDEGSDEDLSEKSIRGRVIPILQS
jgi:cysteine-rich repeat protein